MERKIVTANPGPLGLIGFGMTTILLNVHNAGFMDLSIVIVAMGLMLGGLAQIIAGIMEFKTGNLFGATAFTAYGCFWHSLVLIWVLPSFLTETDVVAADEFSLGVYLLLWAVFTFGMFIGALRHNMITKVVFGSLTLLFLLLALSNFIMISSHSLGHTVHAIAGYVGIFCGGSAIYSALGQVINNEYGKEIVKL